MSDAIELTTDGAILRLSINRPHKRNALTLDMYRKMTEALAEAQTDGAIRVVIISGQPQCFSSGNDLGDFLAAAEQPDALSPALAFLQQLAAFGKPLIAAVEGNAVGIGTTMLLHCDLVYAADNARFQLPFINLALVPEGGSSLLLPAMLGHQRAAELLMLGEPFDADRAANLGLVNGVTAADLLMPLVLRQARKLAEKPPAALAATKALLKSQRGQPLTEVLVTEVEQFASRLSSPEAREALLAFTESRAPDFSAFQ